MLRKLGVFALTAILATLLYGCSVPDSAANDSSQPCEEVTIVITRDFGGEVLLEETVGIEPNTNAMDALKEVADVETKYGGGFVNAINGIGSGYEGADKSKMDWFLYINGISSNVGAKGYMLQDGDVEHWDFRNWSYHQYVPAIIGDFPQPFRHGYKGNISPTTVVYEEWLSDEAESLVEYLEQSGVPDVSAVSGDQLSEEVRGHNNLIVLAKTDNGLISEIANAHRKLGLYIYFEDGKVMALDAEGGLSAEFGPGSGVVQATQNPWNPKGVGVGESVVWMVTGADETGIRNAANMLKAGYQDIKYAYAVIISGQEIIRVPQ